MIDAVWMTPVYPWEEEPVGGIFHQVQAQALVRLGVAVSVLSPTPWAPWPLSRLRSTWRLYARAPRTGQDGSVAVVRPRYPNVPGQPTWARADWVIARAAWRARRHWAGAKVIHGHDVVEGLAAWRLARRARLPFVLTFHGSDMNTWPDEHPERLSDLRTALSDAAAVLTVSASLADRVHAITGVEAVPMPIGSDHRALAKWTLPRDEARRLLDLPNDRLVVLFVGHLLRAKGVRELADAIARLGHPFLGVFVGAGPEHGYGTTNTELASNLLYAGERLHEEVIRYMCAADVLVLPSYSEGLPTVIVEAGSVGLPVIASEVGGVPELLGDGRGTIIAKPSSAIVAEALERFVSSRVEAEAAARRLRAHVLDRYDVDRNAMALLECYQTVIAGAAAR